MNYFSLNKNAPIVTFKEAVINGIAPDKGLYFPDTILALDKEFIENIHTYSNHKIAFEVIKQFVDSEIPDADLKNIIIETLSFEFPLIKIVVENNKILYIIAITIEVNIRFPYIKPLILSFFFWAINLPPEI